MGIDLTPLARGRISGVDVITEGLLLASTQVGLLKLETRIKPILLERHLAGYMHGIHDVFLPIARFRAGSRHPVSNGRHTTDLWLASRQSANAVKRIGRKPVISGHNV